jgi:hypothetical protein
VVLAKGKNRAFQPRGNFIRDAQAASIQSKAIPLPTTMDYDKFCDKL